MPALSRTRLRHRGAPNLTRILITGGVGTGKTTLTNALKEATGVPALATDDALWLPEVVTATNPWAAANEEVARWMARPGPWIIEGVRVPHALTIVIRAAGRTSSFPFTPPMVYLTRARHFVDRKAGAMSASSMSAARHCERRLGVPVLWARYDPHLITRILEIMR